MSFFDTALPKFPLTSAFDYRLLAKKRLPKQLFDFIDGGAFNEGTMRLNSEDYQRIQLRKRVLRDVSNIDTSVEVLGQSLDMPLILAPIGFAGCFARRGEVQAAKAAERAGVPFSLSAVGICSMEEVRKATLTSFWYQFYMLKDKGQSLELLKRAEQAQCPVLLLTVDLPCIGVRSRYLRSRSLGFLDSLLHPGWFYDVRVRGKPLTLGDLPSTAPSLQNLKAMRKWVASQLNSKLTWNDVEWIRANWSGKIILKGILDPEDAILAAQSGVDGIVVSNHGGRHLDGISSTISALPAIVEAVGDRLEVLIDGGIYSGVDIAKAMALGARACMVGRAWAFALAARGEEGVSEVLGLLHHELKVAMAGFGVSSVREMSSKAAVL